MKLHDAPYVIPTEILSTTAQLHEKSHLKKSFSRSAEMVWFHMPSPPISGL